MVTKLEIQITNNIFIITLIQKWFMANTKLFSYVPNNFLVLQFMIIKVE